MAHWRFLVKEGEEVNIELNGMELMGTGKLRYILCFVVDSFL